MSLRKVPEGPLKEGFTTGTSATAAAKAALLAIIHRKTQVAVKVRLPAGKTIEIPVHRTEFLQDWAKCSVIKDAGDDPDVTHGAEIGCEIHLTSHKEIRFVGGEGVGTVTLPGLELPVGEPAINPVPRKMMRSALQKLLYDYDLDCGLEVTVFVTEGRKIAKKTLNERVGIMNGLSILGTTGIVKPYSASSYIASIRQSIDVAVANGIDELVINSGARSEKYLKALFPGLTEQSFVHYGNWIGETLHKIESSPIRKVSIGIMPGKAVKLAYGTTDTHSCVSGWNKDFVANIAAEAGYDARLQAQVRELNMAGRLVELFPFEQGEIFYQKLLKQCYRVADKVLNHKTALDIFLINKAGNFIKGDF